MATLSSQNSSENQILARERVVIQELQILVRVTDINKCSTRKQNVANKSKMKYI